MAMIARLKKLLPLSFGNFQKQINSVVEECIETRKSIENFYNKLEKMELEIQRELERCDKKFSFVIEQRNAMLSDELEKMELRYQKQIEQCAGRINMELRGVRNNEDFIIQNIQLIRNTLQNQVVSLDTIRKCQQKIFDEKETELDLLEQQWNKCYLKIDRKLENVLCKDKNNQNNIEELKRNILTTRQSVLSNRTYIQRKTEFYNHDVERRFYEGRFEIPKDFEEKFNQLISGLDKQSCQTVVQIISRILRIKKNQNEKIDLFTIEEQVQRLKVRETLENGILKISENKFYFDGFYLPKKWFEPTVFLYKHGINKIKNIGAIKRKAIIDAGGFIGDSLYIFSPLTKDNVYSFEPNPENYEMLLTTIQYNNLKNVKPQNLALSDHSGIIEFTNCSGTRASASSYKINVEGKKRKVNAITLDEFVEKTNIDVGLIKTDLEGAEKDFLRGAMQTIKKCKPILLISIYHSIDDFLDIKPMIEDLNLDYEFCIYKGIDNTVMFETMLIAESK